MPPFALSQLPSPDFIVEGDLPSQMVVARASWVWGDKSYGTSVGLSSSMNIPDPFHPVEQKQRVEKKPGKVKEHVLGHGLK